jgi:ABC-2 type transport system ATP-binding protein
MREDMEDALLVDNFHKAFRLGFIPKTKQILKGISLKVTQGEIFGYLGPNGAGKTTTIKCILGLIFADRGRAEIFGRPHLSPKSRELVGFLPENPYFYDYLTAEEFLRFYGQLFQIRAKEKKGKIADLLKVVGLEKSAHLQLRKFSRGMLQRIGLAQALINDPHLVILDEPLSGLDPLGRKEIRDIIVRLRDEGKTVFLSSHILQDIEMICDRVAIIAEGRILNQGKLQDLISQKVLFTEVTLSGLTDKEMAPLGLPYVSRGNTFFLRIHEEEKIAAVVELAQKRKGRIVSLTPRTETLEEIFVRMVKEQ